MPRRTALISAALVGLAATATATATVLTGAGPASAATGGSETYHAFATPSRVVDTMTGAGGNRHGAVPAHGTMTAHIAGHGKVPTAGVAAVAVTLTVRSPKATGGLVAWPHGAKRPNTVNVRFQRGGRAAGLAIVPLSYGRMDIRNNSAGSVQLIADVTGYYTRDAGTAAGAFRPISAARVVDTRTGAYGNRKGPVGGSRTFTARIGGHAGVPSSNVTAVAATVTVDDRNPGSLREWAYGGDKTSYPVVTFNGGETTSGFAMLPTSPTGRIVLFNDSGRSAQVTVDVVGYVTGGVSSAAGTYQPLRPTQVLDTRSGSALPGGGQRTVGVTGRSGVPKAFVRAVVVHLSAARSRRGGALVVWPGGSRPGTSAVQFRAGRNAGDTAVLPVSGGGTIHVHNSSSGSVEVGVTVTGYVLADLHTAPTTSIGRYVREVHGAFDDTGATGDGCQDAAHSSLVLLDIGAQLNDRSGVALTVVNTRVPYGDLTTAVNAYLTGFGNCLPAGRHATVAVGTNNEGRFGEYPATDRGADWANKVIDRLHPPAGVAAVGANDIEPGFASTEREAQNWEDAYLANTLHRLVFNGSADGCPKNYGETGRTCAYGWTQEQIYHLAHHNARISVLPQVYYPYMAVQWANIDRTGGGGLTFAGSLTERAADGSGSLPPAQGWAALRKATYTVKASVPIPAAVDLRVDD